MKADHERLLEQTAEERMISCMRDVFIMRPEAMIAMGSYKRLVALPRLIDNPCMSITAKSGQGKSTIGAVMAQQSCAPNSDWARKVVYIDLVRNTANLNLTKLLQMEIGIQFGERKKPLTLSYNDIARGQRLIRENNVGGVVLDEAQLLLKGFTDRGRELNLSAVKGFAGPYWALNFCLLADKENLETLLKADDTISSRFSLRSAHLPELKCDKSFIAFVKGFVAKMPLRQKSIIDFDFCKKLLELSVLKVYRDGVEEKYSPLRSVVTILKEASRMAIESGLEYINIQSLYMVDVVLKNQMDTQSYLDRYTVIH